MAQISAVLLQLPENLPILTLAGVALVGIEFLSLVAQADFWPDSGFAWTLLVVGVVTIAIAQRGRGKPRASEGAS